MKEYILNSLKESSSMLSSFIEDEGAIANIENAANTLITCLKGGGTIYCCGNGGSMSDAMHFAGELSGRYCKDRAALSAIVISDPIHITCTGNDFGYQNVFARFLEANSRKGDCLLAISTSGMSKNVRVAVEYANSRKIDVVSLTGKANSDVGKLSTVDVNVGSNDTSDKIQELHIKIIHALVEIIEREFFPELY